MSNLSESIKNLYEEMSEVEATHAANNLISFFKVLESIKVRRQVHEESDELKNENIRSTN